MIESYENRSFGILPDKLLPNDIKFCYSASMDRQEYQNENLELKYLLDYDEDTTS